MPRKRVLTIGFLFIVGALATLAVACARHAAECGQCGRAECKSLAFDIRLTNGKVVQTCCPRCGLHYLSGSHPPVAALAVKDFDTAARIDANTAFYVDGSDVHPCTSMAGPEPMDERGCCMKTEYDRCLPSLIAFGSKAKAETFAEEHGGTVKAFAELKLPER
jgi:hypothetical protein